jgi:hypothetical protein
MNDPTLESFSEGGVDKILDGADTSIKDFDLHGGSSSTPKSGNSESSNTKTKDTEGCTII